MNMNILGTTDTGINVYDASCIGGHIHDGVKPIIGEVMSKLIVSENSGFFITTVDMGRVIGLNHLVETFNEDKIVYAKRGDRSYESRFVLNREAEPTSLVTIILCQAHEGPFDGEWVVVTAFEGEQAPKEPGDPSCNGSEIVISNDFWSTHALVPTAEELNAINA